MQSEDHQQVTARIESIDRSFRNLQAERKAHVKSIDQIDGTVGELNLERKALMYKVLSPGQCDLFRSRHSQSAETSFTVFICLLESQL